MCQILICRMSLISQGNVKKIRGLPLRSVPSFENHRTTCYWVASPECSKTSKVIEPVFCRLDQREAESTRTKGSLFRRYRRHPGPKKTVHPAPPPCRGSPPDI